MNTLRNSAFEVLVSAYPAKKGKGRWLNLMHRLLGVKPYGHTKPTRVGTYKIMLDPGDRCDQLFYFGLVGDDHIDMLRAILRLGDCVIDVGANTGYFTALCANVVGAGGSVHSIEANPYLVSRLQDGLSSFPEIAVHHAAAASTNGQALFSVATFSGWSSLRPNQTYDVKEQVEVEQITLDDLIVSQQINKVRLVKLDIEGGEFEALQGAMNALGSGAIDFVFTEVEPNRMRAFGWSVSDLTTLMAENKYTAVAVKAGRGLKPVDQDVTDPQATDILFARSCLMEEAIACLFPK